MKRTRNCCPVWSEVASPIGIQFRPSIRLCFNYSMFLRATSRAFARNQASTHASGLNRWSDNMPPKPI